MNTETATFLLTGGRAPATLDLARQLAAWGHRVLVAESLWSSLSAGSRAVERAFAVRPPADDPLGFAEDLLHIIRTERVQILIPTCEELFYVAADRDRLGEHCRVWTDALEHLRPLHHKGEFIRVAGELGLEGPATREIRSMEALKGGGQGHSMVLKPAFSRFASEVRFLFEPGDFAFPPPLDIRADRPWILQDFVEGREFCTYSLAVEGQLLAHVTYSHGFTAGRAGICFESMAHSGLREWVRRFVAGRHFTGQIAFDFIETPDGRILPLECNPRATSGLHLFMPEDRLDRIFGGALPTEVVEPPPGRRAQLALAMVLYGTRQIRSLEAFRAWVSTFLGARDVVFSWTDPAPAFYQAASLFALWKRSRRWGCSLLEASVRDIAWNGDVP